MTAPFRQTIPCQKCGAAVRLENPFSSWIRANPRLDSITCALTVNDIDLLLHKYMTWSDGHRSRIVQAIMFVEVKTFGATMSPTQRDSLYILNQVLRNRRKSLHKNSIPEQISALDWVHSTIRKSRVRIKLLGGHCLQMQHETTEHGWILWDKKEVTYEQVEGLLSFDLDPDHPKRVLDLRPHHRINSDPLLFTGCAENVSIARIRSDAGCPGSRMVRCDGHAADHP
jgi:hypothetical protein